MKGSGNMNGGTLGSAYFTAYANYLLKAVQAFKTQGFTAYALSLQVIAIKMIRCLTLKALTRWVSQNEPLNSDGTYPSSTLPSATAATIGASVRTLLNNNGLSAVKLLAYEHNWDNSSYPEDVVRCVMNPRSSRVLIHPPLQLSKAGSSFAGVTWHCYAGTNTAMTTVHK